jgi:hypothetical protein
MINERTVWTDDSGDRLEVAVRGECAIVVVLAADDEETPGAVVLEPAQRREVAARLWPEFAAQAARLAAAERVVAAAVDAMAFVAPERWPSILVREGGREALIRLRDETAALAAREGEAG